MDRNGFQAVMIPDAPSKCLVNRETVLWETGHRSDQESGIPAFRPLPHDVSTFSCPAVLGGGWTWEEKEEKQKAEGSGGRKTKLACLISISPRLLWSEVCGLLNHSVVTGTPSTNSSTRIVWNQEPRLAFNRTVVLRYRMQLESRNLVSGHNQRAAGCGSAIGLRGRGCWSTQPGTGWRIHRV